jgi:hypothetical protein
MCWFFLHTVSFSSMQNRKNVFLNMYGDSMCNTEIVCNRILFDYLKSVIMSNVERSCTHQV